MSSRANRTAAMIEAAMTSVLQMLQSMRVAPLRFELLSLCDLKQDQRSATPQQTGRRSRHFIRMSRTSLMLCLALSLLNGQSVRAEQPDMTIDGLARAYRAARAELERRAVCLEAIDAGVIARGHSVAQVDAVFGTTYAKQLPRAQGELEWGVVEFHPLLPPPSDAMSAARIGWLLAFQFDSTGEVQYYYLSNLHK